VLGKERGGGNLLLASSITFGHGATTSVGARNILATNFVSIDKSVDYVAGAKLDGRISVCVAVVQRGKGKKKPVRLFTTKANCGYVALVGVHISADVVAGVVLLAEEVVVFCEFNRQLTVSGEVYTHLSLSIVKRHANSIAEHIRKLETVSVRVASHIG
jgi:hypothetical protein